MTDTRSSSNVQVSREKILLMLQELQGVHPEFARLLQLVQTLKQASPEVLGYIYTSIMDINTEISRIASNRVQDIMGQVQDKLEYIRTQEAAENKKQGNPDELLANL